MMKTNEPIMKLFVLRAKDAQEPPFHFANAPHSLLVAAVDEEMARRLGASSAALYAHVWADEELTDCAEFEIGGPGIIARDVR